MKYSPLFVCSLALLLLVPGLPSRAAEPLVSPEWIETHATDPTLLLVDVSMEPVDYNKGHLPGAVFVCWNSDLADKDNYFYRVPTRSQFEALMSRIGATPETHLVFYDNGQNRFAIRAFWVARYYGHANASILEGGAEAWKQAGLPMVTEQPVREPSQYQASEAGDDMNVTHEYVAGHLQDESVQFIDSRPWSMFTGEQIGVMIDKGKAVERIGHLPGAGSLPWKTNLAEGATFLSPEQLRTIYLEKGIDDQKMTVFYCNEGLHAAFNWFVAKELLGMENVRIYEGSMGEWASEPVRPLVSGIGF